jgi:hypothetical protein
VWREVPESRASQPSGARIARSHPGDCRMFVIAGFLCAAVIGVAAVLALARGGDFC